MSLPENPYISPLRLPGPGERLRSAVSEAGSPYVGTGPVVTRPPHVTAESNVFKPTTSITPETGAFRTVYQAGTPAKWYLQGGQVAGGEGNEVVADIELATVGSEPADGTQKWLEIDGDGEETDGVLLPGFHVTGVTVVSTSSDNVLPEVGTPGTYYHLLGAWNADVFRPAEGGNLNVTFCPPATFKLV